MSTKPTSDEMLMSAVRRGNLAELTPLFERHSRRLFGFLRGLVGNASTAEDLVQESFLRVLRHRKSFKSGKVFLPWLLQIARNAAWTHLQKQSRVRLSNEVPQLVDPRSPEADQLEKQRAQQLAAALQRLPTRDREVLLLSYFEGLRHREIAALVGSTTGAVKVQVHRARRALREHLAALEQRE